MKSMVLVLISVLNITSLARAAKIVGNGGDVYALEFVAVANEAYEHMLQAEVKEISLTQLKAAIMETKVESTHKKLSLNQIPKDAINYPTLKKIIFNRQRWDEMSDAAKPALVLHEYLGILGVDDSSYKYSQTLLADMTYQKNTLKVTGPLTVNFAEKNEYTINPRITLESFGPSQWQYHAEDEKLRLVVYYKGEHKVFLLPIRGRIIGAYSSTDGEDDGLNIQVLQSIKDSKGNPKIVEEEMSEYIPHVVRDYRIEFLSPTKNVIPKTINFVGPISNMAG